MNYFKKKWFLTDLHCNIGWLSFGVIKLIVIVNRDAELFS